MKSYRIQFLSKFCLWATVLLLVSGLSTACKGKKAETGTFDRVSNLRMILGEAKEDYPGVQDIELTGSEFVIFYRFIPQDTNTLQEELGEDLAPKIRKIYESDKETDILHFVVLIPFTEETGGTSFKRQLSFIMTRKIFVETDWAGLLSRDFLSIVKDLRSQ